MLLERLVPGSYLQAHPRRDEAISIVCRLAREEVIVNWDLHLQNVLSAEREPWLLIDPKPLVGDPAFDAGHLQMDPWGERQGRIAELLSASR
jgi:streptomycin 6-kinase